MWLGLGSGLRARFRARVMVRVRVRVSVSVRVRVTVRDSKGAPSQDLAPLVEASLPCELVCPDQGSG